ncbi:MAG: hypothetical protein ABI877_07860, partial [Gemmatimonadaceae bacterium]
MNTPVAHSLSRLLPLVAAGVLFAACADDSPLVPNQPTAIPAEFARVPGPDTVRAITTLRRVTARYHNVNLAIKDGFVLLHPCENRPGEGPVGTVYV